MADFGDLTRTGARLSPAKKNAVKMNSFGG